MNNLQKRAPMMLRDAIKKAVEEGNAAMAARIADTLRFKFGMNYAETAATFNKASGISVEDFESLMYYADTYENRFEAE